MARSYYRGASGALVVYDITNRDSFNAVINWLSDARNLAGTNLSAILVGNKKDLADYKASREVSYAEAEAFSKENDMQFFETSAINGEHIEDVFIECARAVVNKWETNDLSDNITHTSSSQNSGDIRKR